MYELIIKILDKSRDEGVDVLVARDMVAKDIGGHTDELMNASAEISTHYDFITKCRREKRTEILKEFCELLVAGSALDIKNFKEEHDV